MSCRVITGTTRIGLSGSARGELEKKRVTVVLGCSSNGKKLLPMVITKQSLRGVVVPKGMLVKAWMTFELMVDWISHSISFLEGHCLSMPLLV